MNNYTLHIAGSKFTYPNYRYIQEAILTGMLSKKPFTVNLISPEMVVCYWQPGMDKVSYNKYYEDYIMDCQRELVRVTG